MQKSKPLRIVHAADLHLGYRQYGEATREEDFYAAMKEVFDTARREGASTVILAGDTLDAAKPPAHAIARLVQEVRAAASDGITTYGIDGNHDLTGGDWLNVCGIQHIGGKIVEVGGSPGVRIGGIDACRMSQFFERLSALGKDGHKAEILVIHQAVKELSNFNGAEFSASAISMAASELGVQYVAMGDIHCYAEQDISGIRFVYPGSTEVNSSDDVDEKSVSLIEWDGEKVTSRRTPIKTRKFIRCTISDMSLVDEVREAVKAGEVPFIFAQYTPGNKELAKAAESAITAAGAMCRLIPVASEQAAKSSYERKEGVTSLQQHVCAHFDETEDEHQLVLQMLRAPADVRQIAIDYLQEKVG